MKAYDSVSLDFIIDVLYTLNTPPHLIAWIRACITTPRFSISINGSLEGYFERKRGLRQGDPLSLYLFVLAMEVLSKLLSGPSSLLGYKFHYRCAKLNLNHLCFADDILIFAYGNGAAVDQITDVLGKFELMSGLKVNEISGGSSHYF